MQRKKWYVVWKGFEPGVYPAWSECRLQVEGFENALYKSFETQEQAIEAYRSKPEEYIGYKKDPLKRATSPQAVFKNSLSVDASCSGNPGKMEYRGVYTGTGEEIFHFGPMEATNNIGEFLAIVHGLGILKKQKSGIPVYSDSNSAIAWVKNKKCKTTLERCKSNEKIFELVGRAEKWLSENTYHNQILKWETSEWGEIPADFGKK